MLYGNIMPISPRDLPVSRSEVYTKEEVDERINPIVTTTAAEYAQITPANNTLYVIMDY